MEPQRDGGQQGEQPETERDGHRDPGPPVHARPVSDDGPAGDEAGEQEGEHEARDGQEVHGDEQYQREGDTAGQLIKPFRAPGRGRDRGCAPEGHVRIVRDQG